MATDYVLFIHGVTVREPEPATYANGLFASISKYVEQKKSQNKNGGRPSRTLKKVPLYWGNVGVPQEQALLAEYRSSSLWNRFWFRPLREGAFLRFTGDTALYLSRYVGGKVADKLKADAEQALGVGPLDSFQPDPEDRLHLVAHSLGAVILFDILFSARWGQAGEGIPGWDSVQALRRAIYGVEPDSEKGICLFAYAMRLYCSSVSGSSCSATALTRTRPNLCWLYGISVL